MWYFATNKNTPIRCKRWGVKELHSIFNEYAMVIFTIFKVPGIIMSYDIPVSSQEPMSLALISYTWLDNNIFTTIYSKWEEFQLIYGPRKLENRFISMLSI
jgi:hypothetical protein